MGKFGYYFISAIILFLLVPAGTSHALEAGNIASLSNTDQEVRVYADQMPEIVGGIEELYQHVTYPASARRSRIEGRVVIRFVVDEQGNVLNPEILRDIGGGCGEAAIEAIQSVQFNPGIHNGEPVPVLYSLPVTFRLQ
ncbi:energy transducer TonB [Balneolales bacterium ANBcel1]|nr:energy transducer TonB [Balneolales bacterium ANBcel1]